MAAKIALVFLAAFVLFQLLSIQTDATIIRRDAPDASAKKNELEEALNSFKQGVEDLIKKVEGSEIYQNTNQLASEFGQKVKQQGEELIQKIKTSGAAPTPP